MVVVHADGVVVIGLRGSPSASARRSYARDPVHLHNALKVPVGAQVIDEEAKFVVLRVDVRRGEDERTER